MPTTINITRAKLIEKHNYMQSLKKQEHVLFDLLEGRYNDWIKNNKIQLDSTIEGLVRIEKKHYEYTPEGKMKIGEDGKFVLLTGKKEFELEYNDYMDQIISYQK